MNWLSSSVAPNPSIERTSCQRLRRCQAAAHVKRWAALEVSMNEQSSLGVSARCYCGAVGLRSEAGARAVVHCHCGQCRRLGGAAFTTWVSLPKQAVHLSGADSLVVFNATSNVMRHFCKVCGSHVFTEDRRYAKVLGVPAGIIEGQLWLEPKAHYFVSHKAAWHTISDGLPQFGGESGVEAPAA